MVLPPAIASLISATPAAINAAAVAAVETFRAVRFALDFRPVLPLLDFEDELFAFDDEPFLRRVVDPLPLDLLGLRRFLEPEPEPEPASDVTFFTGGLSAFGSGFFGISTPQSKKGAEAGNLVPSGSRIGLRVPAAPTLPMLPRAFRPKRYPVRQIGAEAACR